MNVCAGLAAVLGSSIAVCAVEVFTRFLCSQHFQLLFLAFLWQLLHCQKVVEYDCLCLCEGIQGVLLENVNVLHFSSIVLWEGVGVSTQLVKEREIGRASCRERV